MNIYELQANFWKLHEHCHFRPSESSLYFYLLFLANRLFWVEWFGMADKMMALFLGISLQVLKSSRLRLKEAGLIDFVPGGGHGVKTKYQISAPKSTLKPSSNNINTKEKRFNNKEYGKKKGFVHKGSDFD